MTHFYNPEHAGNWYVADPHTRAHLGVIQAADRDTAAKLYAERRGQPFARYVRPGVYHVPGSGMILIFSPCEDIEDLQAED